MIRTVARPLAVLSSVLTLAALTAAPAHAASVPEVSLPSASCTGNVQVSVGTGAVTVRGTVTCTAPATLNLATTLTVSGVTSTVDSLLSALPSVPLPINTTIPAAGVTAACTTLVNTGTGATVSGSCSAS